ncbi:MAG: DUF6457 domain-containing protein [Candidatus Dormibacteraeota bacterium]|nr:DUF6457 domain-containing protein [Candidatus Dormibacteraeota bacterium]
MDDWVDALAAELGVEDRVDVRLLLDIARETAHSVDRPAAPLTAYLLGYAVAAGGGGPMALADAADRTRRLTARWAPPTDPLPPAT